MKYFFIICSLFLAGCAGRSDHQVQFETRKNQLIGEFYSLNCPAPDGWNAECGSVAAQFYETKHFQKFIKDNCKDGPNSKFCTATVLDALTARQLLRYKRADQSAVFTHCKAYPKECSSPGDLELLLWKSHNDAVGEAIESETNNYMEAEDRDQLRRQQMGVAAQEAIRKGFNNNPSVNCQTRPDYAGGIVTTCR